VSTAGFVLFEDANGLWNHSLKYDHKMIALHKKVLRCVEPLDSFVAVD